MEKAKYTIIAKCSLGDDDYKKWRNVTNIKSFQCFLDKTYPSWKFYNIYSKETRELLKCQKRNK